MRNRRSSASGFSLVEITLALGVAAFALLAILGLIPVGLNSNQTSIEQSTATNIASAISADFRQVPSAPAIAANASLKATSSLYNIDVSQNYTSTSPKVFYLDQGGGPFPPPSAPGSTSRYKVSITLTQPTTNPRAATVGTITVGWPAAAAQSLGSVSFFVALDRN
jgi:uncharacterized protein (TIGR02598 family)